MKKFIVASLVASLLVVSLGAAGLVYAQTLTSEETPEPAWGRGLLTEGERPYGRSHGMMGAFRTEGSEPGMRGGFRLGTPGLFHEYMLDAFAEAVGLTPEGVQARIEAGETRWDIALTEGFIEEEIPDLLFSVHSEALQEMVVDGVITQEQADRMLERKTQRYADGFGPGECNGSGIKDRLGGGRGRGGN